jgi:hypothetical protein
VVLVDCIIVLLGTPDSPLRDHLYAYVVLGPPETLALQVTVLPFLSMRGLQTTLSGSTGGLGSGGSMTFTFIVYSPRLPSADMMVTVTVFDPAVV